MSTFDQLARSSLRELIGHVLEHLDRPISSLTYEELARRIGYLNKHGKPQPRLGGVLGQMGHLLQSTEARWGEPIPYIQSLVVRKSGPSRGLPDVGIDEFWPDYRRLNTTERRNLVRTEYERIAMFGSRWNDVLTRLGLQPVTAKGAARPAARGTGGESPEHVALKEFIRRHPARVGAASRSESFTEYPLPSLDQIDVLFKDRERWVAVEVKSRVSDAVPTDYERGLYQTVKYGAILRAMATAGGHGVPSMVESVLVLETSLPSKYRKIADLLGIKVVEGVNPNG